MLFSCSAHLFGQTDVDLEDSVYADALILEYDPDFDNYKIPSEFEKAPAIVLCRKRSYTYGEYKQFVSVNKRFRTKVLINDKSGLNDFSTIYFNLTRSKGDVLSIRLRKSNGSVVKMSDEESAIKVNKGNVPSLYNSELEISEDYYKMAIPNLEIGDTLEYMYSSTVFLKAKEIYPIDSTLSDINIHSFNPIYRYSYHKYPVIKDKTTLNVAKNYRVSSKALNGASRFKQIESKEKKYRSFETEQVNEPATEDERWFLLSKELPCLKFKVYYVADGRIIDKRTHFLPSNENHFDGKVSEEEIKARMMKMVDMSSEADEEFKSIFDDRRKMLRVLQTLDGEEKKVSALYQYFRLASAELEKPIGDEYFILDFLKFSKSLRIPIDLIAVPGRQVTHKNDLIFSDELFYCLRYNGKFIFPPRSVSSTYDKSSYYLGQKGWVIKMAFKGKWTHTIEEVILPSSLASENIIKRKIEANIQVENFKKVNFEETAQYEGMLKRDYDDFEESFANFYGNKNRAMLGRSTNALGGRAKKKSRGKSARKVEERRVEKEILKQIYFRDLEAFEEKAASRYPMLESVDSFSVLDYAINEGENIRDKKKVVLGDLVKKVGQNYVFEIGKLIGKQVEISEEEQERQFDIWFSYPKTYVNEIRFKIPAGYQVSGTENLNVKLDNPTAKFVSEAREEDAYLIVKTTKVYKKSQLPKEQWTALVEMLDAAYVFTQKSILLKKK